MARAIVITIAQASALRALHYQRVMSACDADRVALEQLTNKGYAEKCRNGDAVTYKITGPGETVYKALT